MKKTYCFVFLCILCSQFSNAQRRSYVQVSGTTYINTSFPQNFVGGGLGAGVSRGKAGIGMNVELVAANSQLILPVYTDFRFYILPKTTSPYISLQAGYNFRNKPAVQKSLYTTSRDNGGVYTGMGIGHYISNYKKAGWNFQLKYTFMQDKIVTKYQHNGGSRVVNNTHADYISLSVAITI